MYDTERKARIPAVAIGNPIFGAFKRITPPRMRRIAAKSDTTGRFWGIWSGTIDCVTSINVACAVSPNAETVIQERNGEMMRRIADTILSGLILMV